MFVLYINNVTVLLDSTICTWHVTKSFCQPKIDDSLRQNLTSHRSKEATELEIKYSHCSVSNQGSLASYLGWSACIWWKYHPGRQSNHVHTQDDGMTRILIWAVRLAWSRIERRRRSLAVSSRYPWLVCCLWDAVGSAPLLLCWQLRPHYTPCIPSPLSGRLKRGWKNSVRRAVSYGC